MSTRSTIRPYAVISAGDMSATTITSAPTVLQSITKFSYEVSWSGTSPVGTLALQVSNTYVPDATGGSNSSGKWMNVPLDLSGTGVVTTIPISGNTGNGFIDITVQAGYAVRLLYTKGSGTGALTATINGKVA